MNFRNVVALLAVGIVFLAGCPTSPKDEAEKGTNSITESDANGKTKAINDEEVITPLEGLTVYPIIPATGKPGKWAMVGPAFYKDGVFRLNIKNVHLTTQYMFNNLIS